MNYTPIILLVLFSSCHDKTSKKTNHQVIEHSERIIQLVDSISFEGGVIRKPPNIINQSLITFNDNNTVYLDRTVLLDLKKSHPKIGEISNILLEDSILYVHTITSLVKFNIPQKKIVSEEDLTFDMVSNFITQEKSIYFGGINMNLDSPFFSLHRFSKDSVMSKSEVVLSIEPNQNAFIPEILLTGYLLKIKNKMVFIFDWIGEYIIVDTISWEVQSRGKLPFFGKMENFEYESDLFSPFYQAYSADVFADSLIWILREVDFESVDSDYPDEITLHKTLRKRMHAFDKEMNLIFSFMLPHKATYFNIIENQLFTVHADENKCYFYEIQNFNINRSIPNVSQRNKSRN